MWYRDVDTVLQGFPVVQAFAGIMWRTTALVAEVYRGMEKCTCHPRHQLNACIQRDLGVSMSTGVFCCARLKKSADALSTDRARPFEIW